MTARTTRILACDNCAYTVPADQPQRLNNHIYYAHGRHQLTTSERTPTAKQTQTATTNEAGDD